MCRIRIYKMVVLPALSRPKTRIRTSLLGLKEENNFEKMMPMLSGSGSCRNRGRKRKRLKNLVYRKTNKEKKNQKQNDEIHDYLRILAVL